MAKFKKGDTVKVAEGGPGFIGWKARGKTGVVFDAKARETSILVQFDGWDDGHDGLGRIPGSTRTDLYFVDPDYLTKVKKDKVIAIKKSKDQTYLGNGKHEWEPVVKASGEYRDGVERLRVPGGWLYRDREMIATTFVPMPEVVKHKV